MSSSEETNDQPTSTEKQEEEVRMIWITPDAEKVISYCARVSNPANQENYDTADKLLRYCYKNHHWSVFEMASMCLEINTTRAIAAQLIRHRSFSFQEFSQRYANVNELSIQVPSFRTQDLKNRQSSHDTLSVEKQQTLQTKAKQINDMCLDFYNELIQEGVAKESARFVLPLSTSTRLYMSGTIRSWIHYAQLRTDPGTQKEHRDLALQVQTILVQHIPSIEGLLL